MTEYFLGHSPAELQRLTLQAEYLRPVTERMLRAAGIRPGMRVLDLGCGAGDVAFLAAELVGSEGYVLGLDRAASAVQFATARAARDKVGNAVFREGAEADLDGEAPFDFAVGRLVLIYQPDPVSFIRTAAARVRPGGIVAFHEPDLTRSFESLPPVPVFDRAFNQVAHALRTTAVSSDVAIRLASVLADAGLAVQDGFCERNVGMGRSDLLFRWIAATYAIAYPALRPTNEPDGELVDIERLAAEFSAAATANHGQVLGPEWWCIWARRR